MAVNENNKNKSSENLSADEKKKMHDNYAAMGHEGGKIGGNVTKETYGSEFYHDIGEKGGNARKEQMAHSSSYTNKEDKENK